MDSRLLKGVLLSFIREDVYFEDVTSKFTPARIVEAEIITHENGVLSGVEEVKFLFKLFKIDVLKSLEDGDVMPKNKKIMLIKGDSRDILLVERTALNILSKMSGITTSTKKYIKQARKINPKLRIAATRKTTPGFRYFEKKAVELAGADTHRMTLSDMILIKDNHLKLLKNVKNALQEAKKHTTFAHKIEIEVTNKKDALTAVEMGADIVMLDNIKLKDIKSIITDIKKKGKRKDVILEASGSVTLENIRDYAKTGVDVVSTSKLTSGYQTLDFSLALK